tara:strand:+ start:5048 stop:5695 length:648 start_codon:yes stop_codon:yes gene_type:complete
MNKNINITNKTNYKRVCYDSLNDVVDSFINILNNFVVDFTKSTNLSMYNHNFILKKGAYCIRNIFSLYINASNNLELTEMVTNNALLYYIEFIGQIHKTNITDLDSKDVLFFVYKKTIFDMIKTNNKYIHDVKFNAIIRLYIYLCLEIKCSRLEEWLCIIKKINTIQHLNHLYDIIVLNHSEKDLDILLDNLNQIQWDKSYHIQPLSFPLRIIYR